jgi:hypothetical protein
MARFRCMDPAGFPEKTGSNGLERRPAAARIGDEYGCSEKKNLAVASRNAPLGGRPLRPDLCRGQGLWRTAPSAPCRSEDRHVSRPPDPHAEVEGRLRRHRAQRPNVFEKAGRAPAFFFASRVSVRAAHVRHENAAQRNLSAPTRIKLIIMLLDERNELKPVEQADV